MSAPLPIPPSGLPVFDPITGGINTQWQNYFLAIAASVSSTNAPGDAQYYVATSNVQLTNERNLGALASGFLKITVAAGIATPSSTATVPTTDLSGTVTVAQGGVLGATYVPTLFNVANVAASTAFTSQYVRAGNFVTVSGQVNIDPTAAATLTQLGISLPVASNFAASEECGGTAVAPVPDCAGAILADAANNRAELQFTSSADVANRTWNYMFGYQVI